METYCKRIIFVYVCVFLGCVNGQMALAGSFSVSPVRIYIKPNERNASLTIVNEESTRLTLKAEIFEWSQNEDGEEILRSTDDIVISPTLMRIDSDSKQILRLATLNSLRLEKNIAYRLVLKEYLKENSPDIPKLSVPIALEVSLPIFFVPKVIDKKVKCEIAEKDSVNIFTKCKNTGNFYTQVKEISVKSGPDLLGTRIGGIYILPGSQKTLKIPLSMSPKIGEKLNIQASFDDGESSVFEDVVF